MNSVDQAGVAEAAINQHIRFEGPDLFHARLKKRVERYFHFTNQSPRDCLRMYIKTVLVLTLLASTYLWLVFGCDSFVTTILPAVLLSASMALVGFNIQHDANHGAFSRSPWINELMGLSLDLVGGSSHMWRYKHNSVHHTFANITGHDDDIDVGVLGRLSPHQRWLPFHRYQHYYLWFFYGFLILKWHLFDDFYAFLKARSGGRHCGRPSGRQLIYFVCGKLLFFTLAFVIPCAVHPVWVALSYYVFIAWLCGLALSIVFQLAHSVELASFPMPEPSTGRIDESWSVHQVETTVNFARSNRVLSWLLGGLNYQVEHHLFPRICHVHYPKLSRIVKRACRRSGIQYNEHHTFLAALASHARWLRLMGRCADPV